MRFILTFFFTGLFALVSNAQAWELSKKGDSIEVYTRTAPNTSIKEYKVIGFVNSSSENIVKTLKDVSSYPKWIEDVKSAKTIAEHSDKLSLYYQVEVPWPFKDRDLVLDMRTIYTDNIATLKLSSNPGLVPVDKNYIRMQRAEGEWLVTRINNQRCLVEQRFLADPEGSIPAWVINMFIVDGPYKTIQNLRKLLASKK